jgi:hypothetical protein
MDPATTGATDDEGDGPGAERAPEPREAIGAESGADPWEVADEPFAGARESGDPEGAASFGEAPAELEEPGVVGASDVLEEPSPRAPGEAFVARARPLVLPALLLVGVLVLIVMARKTLEQAPRFVVDPSVCSVVARPAWVSEQLARSVALAVATGLGQHASLLDGEGLQRWADVLTDPSGGVSPWIESVERLEPRFPHQADLRLRFRRPVLEVDGGIFVAASGHVLGPGPVAVTPQPLRYAGKHLDEDYRECAAAAGELVPFRAELEEQGVRVASVGIGEDGTVVFFTDMGAELSWGRSARKSAFSHLDLPPSERIGNLRQVLLDFPGLTGLRRVQLWTDRPVTVLAGG